MKLADCKVCKGAAIRRFYPCDDQTTEQPGRLYALARIECHGACATTQAPVMRPRAPMETAGDWAAEAWARAEKAWNDLQWLQIAVTVTPAEDARDLGLSMLRPGLFAPIDAETARKIEAVDCWLPPAPGDYVTVAGWSDLALLLERVELDEASGERYAWMRDAEGGRYYGPLAKLALTANPHIPTMGIFEASEPSSENGDRL